LLNERTVAYRNKLLLVWLSTCLVTSLRSISLSGPVRPPPKKNGGDTSVSAPAAENPSYATAIMHAFTDGGIVEVM